MGTKIRYSFWLLMLTMRLTLALLLPLLVSGACSQRQPIKPLATYSRLNCSSLQVSYDQDAPTRFADAPAVFDPATGWTEKLPDAARICQAPGHEDVRYCRMVDQELMLYTALQERPLDALGAPEAIRGVYRHSLGVTVVVRVLPFNGQAVLVAKVVDRGLGSLAWITTRRLSAPEWTALQRAASILPEGGREYFPGPDVDVAPPAPLEALRRFKTDGAGVRIERIEHGVLHILRGTYEWPGGAPCFGSYCDPQSEALSRFFDRLTSLVDCVPPVED